MSVGNVDDFASTLDDTSGSKDIFDNELKAYKRLTKEFKKKTGTTINLTKKYSSLQKLPYYSSTKNRYYNEVGKAYDNMKYNKPLWVTELKLAPELKKLKATIIQIR